jgi:hypothetical protein
MIKKCSLYGVNNVYLTVILSLISQSILVSLSDENVKRKTTKAPVLTIWLFGIWILHKRT